MTRRQTCLLRLEHYGSVATYWIRTPPVTPDTDRGGVERAGHTRVAETHDPDLAVVGAPPPEHLQHRTEHRSSQVGRRTHTVVIWLDCARDTPWRNADGNADRGGA